MYTVERIEDNIVVLESRDNRKIINVDIKEFESNIKENDIVIYDIIKKLYVVSKFETSKVKNSIRDRFKNLKK